MGKYRASKSNRGFLGSNCRGLSAAIALGSLLAATFPLKSRAEFQLHDWKLHRAERGEWNLIGSSSLFSSRTNRDGKGTLVDVSGLDQYRRVAANLGLEWGIHSKLTFFGRATWLWNDIQAGTSSANRFGLSDQTIGLSLRLLDRSMTLDLQVQADIPLYSNVSDAANGLPFLGDSSTDITVGGFLTAPISTGAERAWSAVAGAGYTIRSASFSSAVPWSVELNTRPTDDRGMTFSVGGAGFQSLKNDPRANAAISASTFSPESGGSFLINAVNPSLAAAVVSLGYQKTRATEFTATFKKPLWGQSVADGNTIEVGFRWNLSTKNSPSRTPLAPNKREASGTVTRYISDGKVTGVVNTRTLLISMGSEAGLAMGDLIDIFSVLPDGSIGEPVARGQVMHLNWDQSQINLLEIYQETAIKEGFIARKPIAL